MRDATTGEAKGASLGLAFLLGLLGWLIPLVGYRVALATTCGDGAVCSATDVLAYLLIATFGAEWVAGAACSVLATRQGLGRGMPIAGLLGVCPIAIGALAGPDLPAFLIVAVVAGAGLAFGLGFAGIWAALHLTGAEPGTLADGRRATSDRRIETGGTR